MTEHDDDIRRALETLSSHPPQRDRKPGVHNAIDVVRRRRQIGGGIALSVVTLLAFVAFVALPSGGRGPETALESPAQTPSTAPAPTPLVAPTPEPQAFTAPAPRAPKAAEARTLAASAPSASATPQLAATQSAKVSPPRLPVAPASSEQPTVTVFVTPSVTASSTPSKSATPSVSASVPPSATQSPTATGSVTASAPTEALSADIQTLTATDGSPAPQTTVTVHVRGSIAGSLDSVSIWYTTIHRVGDADTQTRTCAVQTGGLHPVDETFTFVTRYRAAGAQQIDATVNTLGPTCARDATERQWPFTAKVTIPVGSSLSNGPKPVALTLGTAQVSSSRISVDAAAADRDGYVSGFTVNWGTGTPESYPGGNAANCASSEYGGVFWPDVAGSGSFTSPVMAPGTYAVTVTTTATGCDGKDPQTVQQTLTVTVP